MMRLPTRVTQATLASALMLAMTLPAHAHRAWIVPQTTVVAGDSPMITLDAAISNDIFVSDYRAFNAAGLSAYDAEGNDLALENVHSGRFRTTFDLTLAAPGTYRVASASAGLSARWTNPDGSRGMFPGRGQSFNDAELEQAIPADADNLQISQVSRRIETFMTNGQPDFDVIEPTAQGLEMRYLTHPNDLYTQEDLVFQLLIDGEPAAGATVTLLRDGMKYRDQQDAIEVTTNTEGEMRFNLEQAGKYWLEARYQDEQAKAPATSRQGSYVVTLEVLGG